MAGYFTRLYSVIRLHHNIRVLGYQGFWLLVHSAIRLGFRVTRLLGNLVIRLLGYGVIRPLVYQVVRVVCYYAIKLLGYQGFRLLGY